MTTATPQHLIPDALEVVDVALGPVYVAQNELPNNVRSELWFTTTHRNNTELLIGLARRDDDQRAIFATGTSIMKSAIDEAQLAQLTQTSIANLGIAGAHGLGHLGYIETDVLPVSNPGTVVVELSYFFSHRSCTNARAALFAESIRLRDTLLEGNAFTTALSSHDLLIRTSDVTNELNVIGDPAGLWHYPNRDLGVEKVATPDELANFAQRMSDDGPSRCDALLSQLPQTLAATASSSGRTVLLLLPIPPTIYGADPAWTAEFDQFRADLVSLAAASGVELLDLSTLLTDDQFRDFAHMNDKGRAVVTEQVAALLNG